MKDWAAYIGSQFGRLTVLNVGASESGRKTFMCQCNCGNIVTFDAQNVLRGRSKSCGCLRNEKVAALGRKQATHNSSKTPLYRLWDSMKRRCENPKSKDFKWYGGKGVSVCEAWHDFSEFQKWAIESGYKKGLSIDRIDSNKDYSPDNCRLIPLSENSSVAHTMYLTVDGETLSYSQWAKLLGLHRGVISKWMKVGEDYAVLKVKEGMSGTGCFLPDIAATNGKHRDKYITIDGITRNYTDWSLLISKDRCIVSKWVYHKGLSYAVDRIKESLVAGRG